MKKLVLLMKNFDSKPKQVDPLPGTYKKQDFALAYPDYFAELVRAGVPALGDGKPVLITIR